MQGVTMEVSCEGLVDADMSAYRHAHGLQGSGESILLSIWGPSIWIPGFVMFDVRVGKCFIAIFAWQSTSFEHALVRHVCTPTSTALCERKPCALCKRPSATAT